MRQLPVCRIPKLGKPRLPTCVLGQSLLERAGGCVCYTPSCVLPVALTELKGAAACGVSVAAGVAVGCAGGVVLVVAQQERLDELSVLAREAPGAPPLRFVARGEGGACAVVGRISLQTNVAVV